MSPVSNDRAHSSDVVLRLCLCKLDCKCQLYVSNIGTGYQRVIDSDIFIFAFAFSENKSFRRMEADNEYGICGLIGPLEEI